MNKTTTRMTERRSDPLRRWKGLIIAQLRMFPEGLTHMALLLRLGSRKQKDSVNLDKSLRELTFRGIITCDVFGMKMMYKFRRQK